MRPLGQTHVWLLTFHMVPWAYYKQFLSAQPGLTPEGHRVWLQTHSFPPKKRLEWWYSIYGTCHVHGRQWFNNQNHIASIKPCLRWFLGADMGIISWNACIVQIKNKQKKSNSPWRGMQRIGLYGLHAGSSEFIPITIMSQRALKRSHNLLLGGYFEIMKRNYVTYKLCCLMRIKAIVERGMGECKWS